MAPLPKNSIDHFSHEGHPLKPVDSDREFLCDGCKTPGTGKRYRCKGCDFDLHDYCGTCPRLLSSFMHGHSLSLVIRRAQETRICDICGDPVKGMFYRCKECEFDVHPLCTQLPEKLTHALHPTHPFILQSSNSVPNFCIICRNSCNGWRYRCGICNLDIHLGCVLKPVVSCSQISQRGTLPFQPPPQFAGSVYPNFGHYYPNHGLGLNAYTHSGPYMYPQQGLYYPQQNYEPSQNYHSASNNGPAQLGKSIFSLVGQLGFGVISNMVFGVEAPFLFSG